jgi:hypothetical protein
VSNAIATHLDLWAGVNLKLGTASFHFGRMGAVLQPPEMTQHMAALESSGALIGGDWHEAFYAHLDAFLSAARSVPDLIRCCFGVDDSTKMKHWFDALEPNEQQRRRKFGNKVKAEYDAFSALALGTARHISVHRTGVPPVTVTVTGRFGLTYRGGPTKTIPMSEAGEMPPELGWMQRSMPVRPMWTDFDIDGKPLFEACRKYLESAQALVSRARALAEEVHGRMKCNDV